MYNSYERYAKIRDSQGLTDYKVSKLAGIKGTATISNWKSGKYEPKFKTMQAIANVLNVEINDFVECDKENYESKVAKYGEMLGEFYKKNGTNELVNVVVNLDENNLLKVIEYAKLLLGAEKKSND